MNVMAGEIEIIIDDVNDIEARVQARYVGAKEGVVLSGAIRGPFCETARTLPAEIEFRHLKLSHPPTAEAIVPDPCTWSLDVPHLYEVSVVVRQGAQEVAAYRGTVGLRRRASE
jgi:beta-galactosidase/beta-glucuronidase